MEVEGRVPDSFISPSASHYFCPKGFSVEKLKNAALVEQLDWTSKYDILTLTQELTSLATLRRGFVFPPNQFWAWHQVLWFLVINT